MLTLAFLVLVGILLIISEDKATTGVILFLIALVMFR